MSLRKDACIAFTNDYPSRGKLSLQTTCPFMPENSNIYISTIDFNSVKTPFKDLIWTFNTFNVYKSYGTFFKVFFIMTETTKCPNTNFERWFKTYHLYSVNKHITKHIGSLIIEEKIPFEEKGGANVYTYVHIKKQCIFPVYPGLITKFLIQFQVLY